MKKQLDGRRHFRWEERHLPGLPLGLGRVTLVLHTTALYCTALHCTVPPCTALYCTALLRTALLGTPLHCIALHYTALQGTALLYTTSPQSTWGDDSPSSGFLSTFLKPSHWLLYQTPLHCTALQYTEIHSTALH